MKLNLGYYLIALLTILMIYLSYCNYNLAEQVTGLNLTTKQAITNNLKLKNEVLLQTKYTGERLPDIRVRDNSQEIDIDISSILKHDYTIIFKISEYDCLDCIKNQMSILKFIESNYGVDKIAILTFFTNIRQVSNFTVNNNIKSPLYYLPVSKKLFDFDTQGLAYILIVNNKGFVKSFISSDLEIELQQSIIMSFLNETESYR